MHCDDLKLGPGCLFVDVTVILHIRDVRNGVSTASALRSWFIEQDLPQGGWTEQERGRWIAVREGGGGALSGQGFGVVAGRLGPQVRQPAHSLYSD